MSNEISEYQLNNLIQQQVPFVFFSMVEGEIEGDWQKIFSQSVPVREFVEIMQHIQTKGLDMQYPLVLCCQDGKTSKKIAKKLESEGFINVYVVAGGYNKLI